MHLRFLLCSSLFFSLMFSLTSLAAELLTLEWRELEDVRLTELTLENLSDGDYLFKIRVVDKMGLASDFSAGARITLPRSVKQ